MLPEIGAAELLLIAIVALIVVGPKDLPLLLRKVGRFVGRMRAMAADFRASFDEMARQSELDELRKEVEALRTGRVADQLVHDIEPELRGLEADLNARPRVDETGAYASPDAVDGFDDAPTAPVDAPPVLEPPAAPAEPAAPPVKKTRRKSAS